MLAAVPTVGNHLFQILWFRVFLELLQSEQSCLASPCAPWNQHQTSQGWALCHSKMDGFVPKRYPGTRLPIAQKERFIFQYGKRHWHSAAIKGEVGAHKGGSQISRHKFDHGKVVKWNVRIGDGKEGEMSECNRIYSDMLRKQIKKSCKCSVLSLIRWSSALPGVYVYSATERTKHCSKPLESLFFERDLLAGSMAQDLVLWEFCSLLYSCSCSVVSKWRLLMKSLVLRSTKLVFPRKDGKHCK